MEPQSITKKEPLRDVFATQGILVVMLGILICTLHLLTPEFCCELLTEWHAAAEQSPPLDAIAAGIAEWFSSIFSG